MTDTLNVIQAAAHAGVSRRTIYHWHAAGKLDIHQTATGPRINKAELEDTVRKWKRPQPANLRKAIHEP